VRTGCSEGNLGTVADTLKAYADAGVQHVLAAPEDRDLDTYMRTAATVRELAAKL
jgi:hypothetical protein